MSENIFTAIAEIMAEVGYVQKEKKPGLNYSYAGEAALIQALRPSMVAHGVIMYVKEVKNKILNTYTTKNGAAMNSVVLDVVINFHHASSNTWISVESSDEGADTGDKAQNKALTAAYKYAMSQTFCIETGDDPDQFSSAGMEKSTEKAEPKIRVWSIDQLEALIATGYEAVADHQSAAEVLNMSVLPDTAPVKTVQSWFKHYIKDGGISPLDHAAAANEAYLAKKNEKKVGE